ncbi:MAG: hypothetical protein ACJ71Z_02845 [Aeromicrobium sp.]
MGTNPGIVIRDRPGLYPLLLSLDGLRDLESLSRNARREIPELTLDVGDALAPLLEAGAIVDLQGGRARPSLRVELAHDGPSAPLARDAGALLKTIGVRVGPDADLLVVLSSGEPHRAALADITRSGTAHLVVVQEADTVRIGPLVVPGMTPCVNCADLHRAAWDPSWPALVPQFGRSIPSAVPPLAGHTAVTEIAAACLEFAEAADAPAGTAARTVRAIVAVGPDRTVRTLGEPAFHPRCCCSLLTGGA